MYVLKRIDQKGGYVTRPGSEHSYSKKLEEAQSWPTREAAEAVKCENEVVVSWEELLKPIAYIGREGRYHFVPGH